jgi:hypothetical protein
MPYPDALGQRPLEVGEAYEALAQYAADYGRDALLLLMHAALPETLRADLLHLIRVNFLPGHGADLSLEADVLFAPLATALGGGYYRIDPQVRWHALALLRARYRDDQRPRTRRVAELLWRYVESAEQQATRAADPQLAEYLAIQRWVALAFLEPASAAHAFADALRQGTDGPASVSLRLGGLASAIELPLAGEQELLAYARGLDALANGDDEEGRRVLESLGDELRFGDIVLKAPRAVLAGRGLGTETAAAAPPRQKTCIVLMGLHTMANPANGHIIDLDETYSAIKGALEGIDMLCVRADDLTFLALLDADLVLCDLSASDPDTCYMLGICLALRPAGTLLIAERGAWEAFDLLSPGPVHEYEAPGPSRENQARFARWLTGSLAGAPSPLSRSPVYLNAGLRPPRPAEDEGPFALTSVRPQSEALVIQAPGLRTDRFTGQRFDFERSFEVIRSSLQAAGLGCTRVESRTGYTADTLLRQLMEAELVVADLSALMPDVLLLLGIRHGLRPGRTILMAAERSELPASFDSQRILRYGQRDTNMDSGEAAHLAADLQAAIRDAMTQSAIDSPVYAALPHLRPPERRLPKVFISYVQTYARYARPLVGALKALNVDVAWDMDLSKAEGWSQALADMLENADAVVCIAGRDTADREFPMAEIRRAVELGKRLIPVLVEPVEGPPELLVRQSANPTMNGQIQFFAQTDEKALGIAITTTARHIAERLQGQADDAAAESQPSMGPSECHLTIRSHGAGALTFIVDDDARSQWAVDYPPEEVGSLIHAIGTSPAMGWSSAIRSLVDLLLPPELRRLAPPARYRLDLGARLATVPWELLLRHIVNGDFGQPVPVFRWPDGLRSPARKAGSARNVLIIGNPLTTGTFTDENPRLPAPEQGEQLGALAGKLQSRGVDTSIGVGEDAGTVLARLYGGEVGILLITGTSVREYRLPDGRRESGFVLSDGMFLSVAELKQMRTLPVLVILHDPRTGFCSLSEEIAPDLLKLGVPCVVASAWGVAPEWAVVYFEALMLAVADGASFGDAHARAARLCFEDDPRNGGWAAFQAWGDPDFRLPPADAENSSTLAF